MTMAEYIEREAALAFQNELSMLLCKDVVTGDVMSATKDADLVKYLLSLPTADVRPVVRGKWEDVEVTYVADKTALPFERISSMRCNRCNRYHTEIYYYGNPTEMAHYCPNCGADMREIDDEKA